MCKETHKQNILKSLSKKLGDGFNFTIQPYLKTNEKLDGLTILKEGENISPIIYLDSFYKDLENGKTLDDVIQEILQTYYHTRIFPRQFDTTSISDYDIVKDRLYVALINKHLNKELLHDAPHRCFLDDFAVVIYCLVEATEEGTSSFLVRNECFKLWNVSKETLFSNALQNTKKLLGLEIIALKNELENSSTAEDTSTCRMYVMTNRLKISGASTVLFEDALKNFADTESENFYVIFSSIHEVLLIPTSDDTDLAFMTQMNQIVNANNLSKNEILGTKAYYYSKGHGFSNL